MKGYVYRRIQEMPGHHLYVVGFYNPNGGWIPESDHDTKEAAADRVHWLNGGNS